MTAIPVCAICGKDAMPNTRDCPTHWHERFDREWAAREATWEALPFDARVDDPHWNDDIEQVANATCGE